MEEVTRNVDPYPIGEGQRGGGYFSSDVIALNDLASGITDNVESILWRLKLKLKEGRGRRRG